MKYILNETPLKTTNNFRINNISLDLEIKETEFNKYKINQNISNVQEVRNGFNSKIGLDLDKYNYLNINVDNNKLLEINYNFDKNNYLTSQIDLMVKENVNSEIIIKYEGNTKSFNNTKINVNLENNSSCKLTILNFIDNESTSLISIENTINSNSKLETYLIDLCGKNRVYNYYSVVKEYASDTLKNIYLGNNDLIDMNYYMKLEGKHSKGYIDVRGALINGSIKSFKGTIDFIENAKKSVGYENEKCILLTDDTISKSLPMLLCHEEEVEGTHSVSTGKIDDDKMFYLLSRGIDEETAKKMIILSNYNQIIDGIDNEEIKERVLNIVDNISK